MDYGPNLGLIWTIWFSWILAKFFYCMFIEQDAVEVNNLAEEELVFYLLDRTKFFSNEVIR